MKRECKRCGKSFEAKGRERLCRRAECLRERARAAKRAERARRAKVVELRRPPDPTATPKPGSLMEAARSELERAGQVDSLLGRQAMHLAAQLDAGAVVGTAVSSLHKDLRTTMEVALATAAPAGPVDELRRKRMERLGQGA